MSRKNNVWTIVRKEYARFFGDRAMVFTAVLMPGLIIYCIYALMGNNMEKNYLPDETTPTVVFVNNMPTQMAPLFDSLPYQLVQCNFNPMDIIHDSLPDKHCSMVYLSFPSHFDSLVEHYDPQSGETAPNIQIYYNSASPNSQAAYETLASVLNAWETTLCNRFDINAGNDVHYDVADDDEMLGNLLGQLIPMLLLMLLFSGCMAVAPTSIAGEKERGTIATLLVTPMRRSELATGKILSLSTFALLSGLSSFLGIILSLPRMLHADEMDMPTLGYNVVDYAALLFIILSTVLVMVSAISLISAFAKSVKTATTMVTPLMVIIMFIGMLPMMAGETTDNLALYLLPFYNSVEAMSGIFSFETSLLHVFVTVVANLAYTTLAIFGLTKMFGSEKVMFGK
ncbi:MAG: ABC transporter permease subunit [Bacteroidales bacterium]|nr:ABC transporter permease subunit [Bacteroidales bacterium]